MDLLKGGLAFQVFRDIQPVLQRAQREKPGCFWPGFLACVTGLAWCEQGSAIRLESGKRMSPEVSWEDRLPQLLIGMGSYCWDDSWPVDQNHHSRVGFLSLKSHYPHRA